MNKKLLIDAHQHEETRVVLLNDQKIEEFDYENTARKQLKGNVYDRLYKSAKDRIEERNKAQEEYIQDHIKGVMVSPLKGSYRKFGKT